MAKPKEAVREMLDQISDDATFEDIQYHLYVLAKIEHGMEDIEKGRVLSDDEVDARLARWLSYGSRISTIQSAESFSYEIIV